MADIIEYLLGLPVICLIGLIYGIAFLLLPIAQWIVYRAWCKMYGKEYADEIKIRW